MDAYTHRIYNIKEKEKENENDNEDENQEITVTNFRGSPKVLQISKGNYYYLINREKYDITKIMMLIDYNRLSKLGQKFKEYDGGIEKIIFCTLLTNILKEEKMPINELTDLIYGIYKFFAEIDFNGDNNMEWAEFTQFIIDKVEGEHNVVESEQNKEINIIDNNINLDNKKKGINLVFNGQFGNKNGNMRINSIIYNINKNNINLNINNCNYTNIDKNNKFKGYIITSNKKNNNIIKNNIINNQKNTFQSQYNYVIMK